MSARVGKLDSAQWAPVLESLERFRHPPGWLVAVANTDRVRGALETTVREFASGALLLRECRVKRLRLKRGQSDWTGQYELIVEQPEAESGEGVSTQMLEARLIPPRFPEPSVTDPETPLGTEGWHIYLPELRLELWARPHDVALPALEILTDPQRACPLLEKCIQEASPNYRDARVLSVAVRSMRYKPGSRATVVYQVEYPPGDRDKGWPGVVVAKAYSGEKGQNAYEGMLALWRSELAGGNAITIAEPLAYIPHLKVLVQGPIPEEQTLEELVKSALHSGSPELSEQLSAYMRKTAAGLAALHSSGVYHGETVTWEDELADVRDVIERLAVPLPELTGAADPLIERLVALVEMYSADPVRPSHRAFRPAQVLLHSGRVGFIDFDGFCRAEPALDLSRFLRKTKALGVDALARGEEVTIDETRLQHLSRVEEVCETFLAEYERHAAVSRQRVALWEALDLLTLVLYCWTKIEPERLDANILLLKEHLLTELGG
jgi:hypothetical protein